ncbi:MAG: cupin domain-containing protein [Bryobacterales bacterium]|jgi:quercetin dioxygenase-like cupin family protein|nr:cupin domain-containing protein [Bryobacterales bacterium]
MKLYAWDHVREETLNSMLARQVIHGEKMTVAMIRLRKGAVVPAHQHDHEQLSAVQSGRVSFVVAGEKAMLGAGDMILIPPGAPHAVEALTDSLVLDTFSPARDDWQRGDDAYLRGQDPPRPGPPQALK